LYAARYDAWHYTPGANKAIITAAVILFIPIQLLSITTGLVDPTASSTPKRSLHNMVEIFVMTYLVIGLLAALLFWAVLMVSKRLDNESQSMNSESPGDNQFFESKTESINFYSS